MSEARSQPYLDPSLLPMYQRYKQENASWLSQDFTIWNYLTYRADLEMAVAFSKLFWPDFIEVDGCVLLAEHYSSANFQSWKERYAGEMHRIEAVINHAHVYDLFGNSPADVEYPDELPRYLAEVLAACWRCSLQHAFPARAFVVEVYEGYGPEVTFYQVENTSREGK